MTRRQWLWWGLGSVAVLLAVVFVVQRADDPADPEIVSQDASDGSSSTSGTAPRSTSDSSGSSSTERPSQDREPLEGFEPIPFTITTAEGTAIDWCALLAADPDSRAQGLMGQDDLLGYDGMLFRFPEPSEGRFYMRNVPVPLSIAFFDSGGELVSVGDMAPCPDEDGCPTYGADGPYLHALEVPEGGLAAIGVTPGAVLSFPGGSCPG